MSDNKPIAGELGQCDHPNWEPLLALVGELLVAEFMWMSQIDLADGRSTHAYKHIVTRQYLYVAEDGTTLASARAGQYAPIDARAAIAQAIHDPRWPA